MLETGIPFSNAPGVAYEYSNYGFAILGRVVARVSGQPYAAYVKANILQPLGMTSTTLEPASVPRVVSRLAIVGGQHPQRRTTTARRRFRCDGWDVDVHATSALRGIPHERWPPRDDADPGPVKRSSLREMQQTARSRPATVTGGVGTAPLQLSVLSYGATACGSASRVTTGRSWRIAAACRVLDRRCACSQMRASDSSRWGPLPTQLGCRFRRRPPPHSHARVRSRAGNRNQRYASGFSKMM